MENKVIKEIDNLLSLIEQYQLKGVHPQVNTLKELQYSLNHHIKLSTREKINIHNALFIPRGGIIRTLLYECKCGSNEVC